MLHSHLNPQMPVLNELRARRGAVDGTIGMFMGLQHLFGSTASLIDTIANDRIAPQDVFLLGKPYSTNPQVMRFLEIARGYWVHPDSTAQMVDVENDRLLDSRIETVFHAIEHRLRNRRGNQPSRVLLIDDGGRAIRLLHSDRFAAIRPLFTCVEQTRCGARVVADLSLEVPVINVAESWVKLEYESPLIAESVTYELTKQLAAMHRAGIENGARALVIGYGSIGRAVSAVLRDSGHDVAIYETDAGRRVAAFHDGFDVCHMLRPALERGGIIVGCTGLPVLDHEDYRHIGDGAVLISASSADVEFRAWQLRRQGENLGRPQAWDKLSGSGSTHDMRTQHPCFSLYRIQQQQRRFYLVNGGFPVNFDGGIDPIEPRKIQLTRSLLFLGALQASRTFTAGLFDLDSDGQHQLMNLYETAMVSAERLEAAS